MLFFKNVIPAEAGIQRYLNVILYVSICTGFPLPATCLRRHKLCGHKLRENNIFLIPACAGTCFWFPAYAGTSLDSRFRGNDKKEYTGQLNCMSLILFCQLIGR
jgi:hypothetical protein